MELKSIASWARTLENILTLLGKLYITIGEECVAKMMLSTTSSHDTKSLARCGVPKKNYTDRSEPGIVDMASDTQTHQPVGIAGGGREPLLPRSNHECLEIFISRISLYKLLAGLYLLDNSPSEVMRYEGQRAIVILQMMSILGNVIL